MAKLSTNRKLGTQHPRENFLVTGSLASVNAELLLDVDGCSTCTLDTRGTFVGTVVLEGTIDGTNWQAIPVKPMNAASVLLQLNVTTAGTFMGECVGFDRVRVRMTAYTSGAAITTLLAVNGILPTVLDSRLTASVGTSVGAAGAAVTLTLASPGAGLRHYLTYLSVNRFATAALTAAATPVTITTTNLPGSLAFSFPAEAALQGTIDRWREDFAFPIAASAQNTATTIVCPATTGVIWRATAGFYVAP